MRSINLRFTYLLTFLSERNQKVMNGVDENDYGAFGAQITSDHISVTIRITTRIRYFQRIYESADMPFDRWQYSLFFSSQSRQRFLLSERF